MDHTLEKLKTRCAQRLARVRTQWVGTVKKVQLPGGVLAMMEVQDVEWQYRETTAAAYAQLYLICKHEKTGVTAKVKARDKS